MKLKRWVSAIRYSAVGVMLAGVFSTVAGCSAEDAIRALLVILGLSLGAGTDQTTTGGPAAPTSIVLYDSGRVGKGDIGDRAATTAICATSVNKPPEFAHAIALLSYTASDAVINFQNLPEFDATKPVKGPTGVSIGTNWADLFDNSIATELSIAVPGGPTRYWTGTAPNGTNDGTNCSMWTDGTSGTNKGKVGDSGFAGMQWLRFGGSVCNTSTIGLLCVAY